MISKIHGAFRARDYLILPHARQHCDERGVRATDVEQALVAGHPVPKRDRFDEILKEWSYCFEGFTVDGIAIRVVVAFMDKMVVVTVVRPTVGEF